MADKNPFDQFDEKPKTAKGNPFDRFDAPPKTTRDIGWAEKIGSTIVTGLAGAADFMTGLAADAGSAQAEAAAMQGMGYLSPKQQKTMQAVLEARERARAEQGAAAFNPDQNPMAIRPAARRALPGSAAFEAEHPYWHAGIEGGASLLVPGGGLYKGIATAPTKIGAALSAGRNLLSAGTSGAAAHAVMRKTQNPYLSTLAGVVGGYTPAAVEGAARGTGGLIDILTPSGMTPVASRAAEKRAIQEIKRRYTPEQLEAMGAAAQPGFPPAAVPEARDTTDAFAGKLMKQRVADEEQAMPAHAAEQIGDTGPGTGARQEALAAEAELNAKAQAEHEAAVRAHADATQQQVDAIKAEMKKLGPTDKLAQQFGAVRDEWVAAEDALWQKVGALYDDFRQKASAAPPVALTKANLDTLTDDLERLRTEQGAGRTPPELQSIIDDIDEFSVTKGGGLITGDQLAGYLSRVRDYRSSVKAQGGTPARAAARIEKFLDDVGATFPQGVKDAKQAADASRKLFGDVFEHSPVSDVFREKPTERGASSVGDAERFNKLTATGAVGVDQLTALERAVGSANPRTGKKIAIKTAATALARELGAAPSAEKVEAVVTKSADMVSRFGLTPFFDKLRKIATPIDAPDLRKPGEQKLGSSVAADIAKAEGDEDALNVLSRAIASSDKPDAFRQYAAQFGKDPAAQQSIRGAAALAIHSAGKDLPETIGNVLRSTRGTTLLSSDTRKALGAVATYVTNMRKSMTGASHDVDVAGDLQDAAKSAPYTFPIGLARAGVYGVVRKALDTYRPEHVAEVILLDQNLLRDITTRPTPQSLKNFTDALKKDYPRAAAVGTIPALQSEEQ